MKSIYRSIMLASILCAPITAIAVHNGDFTTLNSRADGQVHHTTSGQVGFLPGWTLVGNHGGILDTSSGETFFRFHTLTDAFGDNKLDQCILIDPTRDISFSYQVRTNASPVTNDLRVRINPHFYTDVGHCERDLQANSSTYRISGSGQDNVDRDVRLNSAGVTSNQWHTLTHATHGTTGPLLQSAANLPQGATAMRLSLRVRDDLASPSRQVWIDNISVTQEGSPNRVQNSGFSHIALADQDPLGTPSGWVVNRDGNGNLRAGAGAFDTDSGSRNHFYFSILTGSFGASGLDQCFPVDNTRSLRPSVRAATFSPHDNLEVRINVDFFSSSDCSGSHFNALRLQQDFPLNIAPGEWKQLVTSEERTMAQLDTAASARISVRARDRSHSSGNGPDDFQRTLLIDEVITDGLDTCNALAQIDAYEVKAFLDPALVLNGQLELITSVKNALNINGAPYLFNVQYLDTELQTLIEEGWSIRTRKRADQGAHRIQFKKRYPVDGDDLPGALAQALNDGFDACTGQEVEVDWAPNGRKTLAYQIQIGTPLNHAGLNMPDLSETRALALIHANAHFLGWIDNQWGEEQVDEARLYGPVFFERYPGDLNGIELVVEVWHILNETGDDPDYLVEVSFKTANATTASNGLTTLLALFSSEGWLLDEDILKTRRVLDRH